MDDLERAHALVAALDAASTAFGKLYFYVDTDSPVWASDSEEALLQHLADAVAIVGELDSGALRDDVSRIGDILRDRPYVDTLADLSAISEQGICRRL